MHGQGVLVVQVVVDPGGEGLPSEIVGWLEGPLVVVPVVELEVELLVVRGVEAVQVPADGGGGLVVNVDPALEAVTLALHVVVVLESHVLVRDPRVAQERQGGRVAADVVLEGEVAVLPRGNDEAVREAPVAAQARVGRADLNGQVVVVEPRGHSGGDVVLSGAGHMNGRLQIKLHLVLFFGFFGRSCAVLRTFRGFFFVRPSESVCFRRRRRETFLSLCPYPNDNE
mmetsp:Transcript_6812/g.19917  ORF Transcript_6812/g.19917 Transcript_6812/m.19917 type:complete len:227 (-) Transcript_6812:5-685(-)